jgi:hypothetical protein
MRIFLEGEYRGVLFELRSETVAYALYREQPEEIYLRQLCLSLATSGDKESNEKRSSFYVGDLARRQAAHG